MASPPYTYSPTALSPPAPSRSQLPPINTMTGKRKPTTDGAGPPALKRRKASTMSVTSGAGSAHPLRQTSFPPDEFGAGTPTDARSPSVDIDAMSFVSGSQVSAPTAPIKKKRGRKSKAEKALQREQTPSTAGGKALSTVGGASDVGGRGGGGKGGAADDGDGEDDGPTEVAATGTAMTKEQKEEEHRARGMLINAFSEDQFDRFENWRAANFSKAGVRRLVNATISQSVTENVVIGMRAVAKVYIGDIIELARRVQNEWVENTGEKQTDLPTPPASAAPSPNVNGEAATGEDAHGEGAEGPAPEPPKDDRRGPLRPDHLREAVRRYRRAFEGGGVGMQRVWHQQQQNGSERFPPRTGGRRIFR